MYDKAIFIRKTNRCQRIVKKYIDNIEEIDLQYLKRYKVISNTLEDMKKTIEEGTVSKNLPYLPTNPMIIRNDPEDLFDCMLDLNKYYCENYKNSKLY
ncbi:hypothetical protein [Dethiothermospora halolimnae]|uniref:hypothetical protein n=1 Tax=Dethiothermospora halolimnae TaxID=3114390 RepID=UPI003CCB9D01